MPEPTSEHSVFVSHTHDDKRIVDAFAEALRGLLGERLVVYSSSSKEEGGIRPGEEWFRWITERVRECDVCFVFLTPSSIQKPWILWEAGAVAGAALATESVDQRKVRPVLFQVRPEMIPTPFQHWQTVRGDDEEDLSRLFTDMLEDYGLLSTKEAIAAAKKLDAMTKTCVAAVRSALLNAPLPVTEAAISEWCERLDDLRARGRASEVGNMHDWLDVAFGRERDDRPRPLDLRIHRRLGELYLGARNPERAAEQLELARQLSPRDIFVLRALGQAYLSKKEFDKVKELLDVIERLDRRAFTRNVECAALLGRWHRDQNAFGAAAEAYAKALAQNPESYYLADLLAQARLQGSDRDGARQAFELAFGILERLHEENVWTHATAATAALATGREEAGLAHLSGIREAGARPADIESIESGLRRLKQGLGVDDATFGRWIAALR